LVFIKLYEEKKEKEESQKNRFALTSFKESPNRRDKKKVIHKLLADIKDDHEIKCSITSF